jgi:hypothetical protein
MSFRHTTRTAARVAALGLGLGLSTVALGGCLGVDGVTAGTVTVYNPDEEAILSFALGEEQEECAAPSTSASATSTGATTGTITATATSDQSSPIPATSTTSFWRVQLTTSVSGTYTGNGTAISLTGSATVVFRRVIASGSCTVSGTGTCTLSTTFPLTGATSPASLPTFAGTTTVLNGIGTTGDITVSGTATACGVLVGANGGSISISGLTFEA